MLKYNRHCPWYREDIQKTEKVKNTYMDTKF